MILSDLEARGLLYDCTHREELERHLSESTRRLYVGFDPTADSLHVGSLLPLLTLKRFADAGHEVVLLIGGGTGLIGDPSGRTDERSLQTSETVATWATKLKEQAQPIIGTNTNITLVDNNTWLGKESLITFLRDIGKEFTVNYMLAKESVSARLSREEGGISFTEFSYMLLQSYDFLHLYQHHNCTIQIGGSDQWGNITAGCELIRRKLSKQAYGLTLPLITKADGSKFGKSQEGTVWLDPHKTSAYHFYQFWINTPDADITNFMHYFSMKPLKDINELIQASQKEPHLRIAQKALAEELTTTLHGTQATTQAIEITSLFFNRDYQNLTQEQCHQLATGNTTTTITSQQQQTLSLVELLITTQIATSKRQAREFISVGAITINGIATTNTPQLNTITPLHNQYYIISKGKKTHKLVAVQ